MRPLAVGSMDDPLRAMVPWKPPFLGSGPWRRKKSLVSSVMNLTSFAVLAFQAASSVGDRARMAGAAEALALMAALQVALATTGAGGAALGFVVCYVWARRRRGWRASGGL